MEYRKDGELILVRIDKGEEILEKILDICHIENICGAVFSGIGACGKAVTSSYIPEKKRFCKSRGRGIVGIGVSNWKY